MRTLKHDICDKSMVVNIPSGGYFIVDEEDFEKVNKHNWGLSGGYISTKINRRLVLIHRFVMGVTDRHIIVDHKFHNIFDNRKSQLRLCTQSQNMMNQRPQTRGSSVYKGVCYDERNKEWKAQIRLNKCLYYLGLFENEVDAAITYDNKAKELFGEFAYLNFK